MSVKCLSLFHPLCHRWRLFNQFSLRGRQCRHQSAQWEMNQRVKSQCYCDELSTTCLFIIGRSRKFTAAADIPPAQAINHPSKQTSLLPDEGSFLNAVWKSATPDTDVPSLNGQCYTLADGGSELKGFMYGFSMIATVICSKHVCIKNIPVHDASIIKWSILENKINIVYNAH